MVKIELFVRKEVNWADDVDPTFASSFELPAFLPLFVTCDDTNDIRSGPDRPSFDLTF